MFAKLANQFDRSFKRRAYLHNYTEIETLKDLTEFEELRDNKLPEPTVKETVYETYSASRGPAKPPRVPEPYKTFADTFSYGV